MIGHILQVTTRTTPIPKLTEEQKAQHYVEQARTIRKAKIILFDFYICQTLLKKPDI